MEPPESCDVVIVGAGIIGLATARELSRRHPGLRLAVLEKEQDVGFHQTGHNSGVVHAGIYYAPGSLKARLCVQGARELYEYCERHRVPFERCGKVIVAVEERELPGLGELERRGRANDVPGLRRIGAAELAELEPSVRGVAALHSPATGIVDFPGLARAIARELVGGGVEVVTGCAVSGAERHPEGLRIRHAHGETLARGAVFCAGQWADRLARAAGAPADPRIVPFRGAYLRLRPERRGLGRSLIYPVPDPSLPFLGVHLTRHIDGEVLVGPTALLAAARDAYRLRRVRLRDVAGTLAWPGTWRLSARLWRVGLAELRMAASTRSFVREAARYVPSLSPGDVLPGPAGIRAQALGRDGRLVDDFVVSRTERALHVRNAPSPAATSSLALARLIADEADGTLGLGRH
jgi:L-2-hydroxyglutarate oxidase